jgi:inosine-uridine nucleoside N-ribohydrolase
MTDLLGWPLVQPRARVIIDNDYSGDPDDLIQTVHHLLSPSVEIPMLIASHLSKGDPWDPTDHQASNAEAALRQLLAVMGVAERYVVHRGSEVALTAIDRPQDTPAARAIIAEAMRTDTELPLYYAAGAGLTELASALLIEPAIAGRMTLVWIGGAEYPELSDPPPGGAGIEYNLRIDVAAAQVVFNSDIPIWQVPRNVYRQILMTYAELLVSVAPHGALGQYLRESIEKVMVWTAAKNFHIGEAYAMGDSPLVTLTALQSAFQPDPSSSFYVWHERLTILDDGSYGPKSAGQRIRVYTQIDTRLTFGDVFAKLALWNTRQP